MSLFDLFGFLGMVLLLSAFLVNQLKYISTDSSIYQVLNLFGAYILTYYAFVGGNIPFIILEFVWGTFALYKLITGLLKKEPSDI